MEIGDRSGLKWVVGMAKVGHGMGHGDRRSKIGDRSGLKLVVDMAEMGHGMGHGDRRLEWAELGHDEVNVSGFLLASPVLLGFSISSFFSSSFFFFLFNFFLREVNNEGEQG